MRRTFLALFASVGMTAFTLLASVSPAAAQDEEICVNLPSQVRTAAATAEPKVAKRALSYAATGEKLCEAGNDRDDAKKFKVALKTLGVEQQAAISTQAAAQ